MVINIICKTRPPDISFQIMLSNQQQESVRVCGEDPDATGRKVKKKKKGRKEFFAGKNILYSGTQADTGSGTGRIQRRQSGKLHAGPFCIQAHEHMNNVLAASLSWSAA